jgi:dienelactone hydrolase
MTPLNRRTFLGSLASLVLASSLAGCNESADSTPTAGSAPTLTSTSVQSATETLTESPTETPTESPTETASPTPTDATTAQAFVRDLGESAYDRAREHLATAAADRLSADTLERLWLGLTAQHGAFQEVAGVERMTDTESPAVIVTARCVEVDQPVRCTFDDAGDITRVRFPAEYSPPAYADESAFTERPVTVEGAGCSLSGTLSVPEGAVKSANGQDGGDGTVPGVVLVHGSGQHDRDETIGPNKPFRDLAWGLATRGVAVLRYEKRTGACDVRPGDWDINNIVVEDAVQAVELLGAQDEVDPGRRYVVGHSLGAICTPRIAERTAIAGGAMLAASARPITDVVRDQQQHLLSVVGGLGDEEKDQLSAIDETLTRVENGDVASDERVFGIPGSWWSSLLAYDQVATAKRVETPLALFQGGRDYQVTEEDDFARWRSELADRPNTSTFLYPGLSHLFQSGTEPSLGAEYSFHDNVAESVVTDIAAWVDRTGS